MQCHPDRHPNCFPDCHPDVHPDFADYHADCQDVYPEPVEVWEDKFSDAALTRFVFFGLGVHRIEPLREGGRRRFVLRTNQLADLAVRDGFDTYGGDAVFDSDWRVLRIERWVNGSLVVYRPGEPRWSYAKCAPGSSSCVTAGLLPARPDHSRTLPMLVPFTVGGAFLAPPIPRFVFRSSVFTLVTVIDHLYQVHLNVGNGFVQASKTSLSAAHPLRRFLAPFLYQTATINDNARSFLISKGGFGPRNFALTEEALTHVWAHASSLSVDSLPYFRELQQKRPRVFERMNAGTTGRHR